MERRSFLKALGGFAGALALNPGSLILDPDRELWKPGVKTIFLPQTVIVQAPAMIEPVIVAPGRRFIEAHRVDFGGKRIRIDLFDPRATDADVDEALRYFKNQGMNARIL